MEMPQEYNLSLASELLDKGKKLFELEKYPEAVAQLHQAQILVSPDSALGGEVQIWLANTYDVMGDTAMAIAICQKLINHEDLAIAKQANFLVNIFSAPELAPLQNVTSTLPNLNPSPQSFAIGNSPKRNTKENSNSNLSKSISNPTSDQNSVNPNYLKIRILICLSILITVCFIGIWLQRFT